MPAIIYRSRGWVVLGLKPAGLLLLMAFLVVSLACNSTGAPASTVPSPEPTLVAPRPSPTVRQAEPTATRSNPAASGVVAVVDPNLSSPSTTGPAASDPGNDKHQALLASALSSLPIFHQIGDDPDMPRFGPVLLGLEYVADKMAESGDLAYVPILVDFLRLQIYYEGRASYSSYLDRLVGDDAKPDSTERNEWMQWSVWLAGHPEIEPPMGYAEWKGRFLAHIDPGMGAFFYDGVKTRILLEEAVGGGVAKDGIPDLINPTSIPALDARYLRPTDRVFGVLINEEHRAYPLRILNPHEMANDVLGGVPFALAY